uniref:Scaffolding anchor of CK1 domain-containing protein n=1 Tax=Knipowitschia caucasica TaxID=637954 RepID=A0AAV2KB32_KNICA
MFSCCHSPASVLSLSRWSMVPWSRSLEPGAWSAAQTVAAVVVAAKKESVQRMREDNVTGRTAAPSSSRRLRSGTSRRLKRLGLWLTVPVLELVSTGKAYDKCQDKFCNCGLVLPLALWCLTVFSTMAHRSQSSSVGDNPLDPNFLPPHYREEYRIAIDALIENDIQGYLEFLQNTDVPSFLAEPEIQHIKCTSQGPNHSSSVTDLTYHERGLEDEGSSDTYWPIESDLAAPGLDLGWPLPQHCFIGPTEVTTLVNPSDPDMPSIKEQARRLIKTAHHVIAVVMDIFTDIDLFSDLLEAAARHVPVYILLDEQDAPHFVSMVNNCKVNLDLIPMVRVRTVAGIPYYSRTGKSFKGQVKDRFLLVDCRAVLSGNYSFMWSYEKIHRSIAHLFLGELVKTFDEEFRILFAQNDPFRHTIEPSAGITIGKYSQQQFRLQQSFLEQGRSIVSRQVEMGSSVFKRHSYAEGTQENYTSSRQFMKHRVMNNLDETDFHREQVVSSQFYSEANSQKNRQERGEESGGDSDSADKGQEKTGSLRRNLFLRPHSSNQEREGLLKRIESMRKEKKVYSRFEMGNSLG